MAKLITVFGATGTQGGSVVRALLKDSGFKVRGVTRNVGSDKAKALTAEGKSLSAWLMPVMWRTQDISRGRGYVSSIQLCSV